MKEKIMEFAVFKGLPIVWFAVWGCAASYTLNKISDSLYEKYLMKYLMK